MPTSPRGLARGQQFSRAATPKPSGGIRSLPSLSAWGLPMLAANKPPLKGEGDQRSWWRGSAEIFCSCFRFHRRNPSVKPAACQLPFQGSLGTNKPPLKREGDQRSWWRDSFTATAANRFHKEAKKEKNSPTLVLMAMHHTKITRQQKSPGGANRRLPPP